MCQRPTMLIHVLSRTVKQCFMVVVCITLLCACTIRSGEQVVMLQPTPNQLTALAVRFVGSEGVMWRTIGGLQPDTAYQVELQAQIQSGAMQLRFRDDLGDGDAVIVVPGRIARTALQVRSNARGEVALEEMTYESRGGEYQLQFVPYTASNLP